MKHHEYTIYLGGFKKPLEKITYCKDCHNTYPFMGFIYTKKQHRIQKEIQQKQQKNLVRSHKK